MSNEIVLADGEVVDAPNAGALAEIAKAEVFQGIESARKYRRSIEQFMRGCIAMVSYSPAVASKFRFTLPKRGADGQPISGVSIHGAKMLASAWGNLRVGGRVVSEDDRFVTAQGICHDLESNVLFTSEVRVPIVDRNGRRYGEDMVKNAAGAAVSKAIRNAILSVIPPAFVEVIEEEAVKVARGDSKSLPERVGKAIGWFAGKGVDEHRVLAALGVGGRADVNLAHISTLQGFKTAIEEGARVDDIFPLVADEDVDRGHHPTSRSAELAARIGRTLPSKSGRQGGERPNGGRRLPPEDIIDVEAEVAAAAPTPDQEHAASPGREPGEDG